MVFLYIFIFGTIIGSFLNVVIYRYNTWVSLGGRSYCDKCGKYLSWYELIPVISFLLQSGRCRSCHIPYSIQYPLVEFITGIVFALSFFKVFFLTGALSPLQFLTVIYYWTELSLLIIIAVYDFRHKIIPNGFVYSFAVAALLYMVFLSYITGGFPNIFDLLAGPILFFPFAALWFVSRGAWMGLGDAKLSLGIGWFLGLYYGVGAITLSFWLGALFSLILLSLKGKMFTMKSEIPFGPFLILGVFLVFFFSIDIFSLFI